MQETVVHTYCDIDFIENGDHVEGRRINWLVNGKPWCLDVCQRHGLDIKLLEIDIFVEKYGHPEGAKPKPPKKTPAKKTATQKGVHASVPSAGSAARTGTRPSKAKDPLGPYHVADDGKHVCDIMSRGGSVCGTNTQTLRGLKKHQTQMHPELLK
jgi:hypothetical protein